MEHIDGSSLYQLLASRGPLAPELAISILKQTAAALDYAHQFGVVHRDIKPANIMLQGDVTVKVADFGVAKVMSAHNQTLTGMLMGTPSYMSPEQIEAQPVDGKSDQFSLAVMAYELLTGVRPFLGESMATVAHLIVYGDTAFRARGQCHAPAGRRPGFGARFEPISRPTFPQLHRICIGVGNSSPKCDAPAASTQTRTGENREKAGLETVRLCCWIRRIINCGVPIGIQLLQEGGATIRRRPRPVPAKVESATVHSAPAAKPVATPVVQPPPVVEPPPVAQATPTPPPPPAKPKPVVPAAIRAQQLFKSAVDKRGQGKPEESRALFQQAAELGDAAAMYELAENYSTGAEALQWFNRAAEAGNSQAMLSLGGLYLVGSDVAPQNDQDAAQWFQKAAGLKNPSAMYNLAGLYEEGRGVARDADKARQLYQEAAALGNALAQRRLTELGVQK